MAVGTTVREDAGGASVTQTGTVTRGDRVVGVSIAGRSTSGVGTAVTGTYGALTVAADGSYSYVLDGGDRDTRLLGAGETGYDRFTYSYETGGVVKTETIVVAVAGVDQAGVQLSTSTAPVVIKDTGAIAETTRIVRDGSTYPAAAVQVEGRFTGAPIVLTNAGAISAVSKDGYLVGIETNTFLSSAVNDGRVSVTVSGRESGATGIVGSQQVPPLAQPVVNRGVVQVELSTVATFSSGAVGIGARIVDNSGTIVVLGQSATAMATGISGQVVTNSGTIWASSGDKTGFVGISAFAINSSSTNMRIVNSGTLVAEATAPGLRSAAIKVFMDSSNPLAGGTITNTGRIIADYAFYTLEGYFGSIGFWNAGQIEGDWSSDKNVSSVLNSASATWAGAFAMGFDPDVVRNDGTITGLVNLGRGADLYDGSRGTSGTRVFGGEGNDVLRGGRGGDQLDGADGDDVLFGGSGDLLAGGAGADRFVVSGAATIADFETGRDVLDLSALLPTTVSIATSGGETIVTARTGQGDTTVTVRGAIALADIATTAPGTIQTGTAGADTLIARTSAAHRLSGAAGDDVLVGGDGADVLDGGTGGDVMYGGDGDDIYYHDSFDDRAIETANGGIDEVRTSVGYLLAPYIENGRIIGTEAAGLTGNDMDNRLWGNAAANEINGGFGDDIITGGLGADRLIGGAGADRFVYETAADSVAGGFDYLVGFETGVDRIDLTAIGIRTIAFEDFYNPWAGIYGNYTTATITTSAGAAMVIRADGRLSRSDFLGFAQVLPTEVVQAMPGDATTGVQPTADLRFLFTGAVSRGSGTITLSRADGTVVETFASDSGRLAFDGRLLTIDPTRPLDPAVSYTLAVGAGALRIAGTPFAGFAGYGFATGTQDMTPQFQLLVGDRAAATVSGNGTVVGLRGTLQDVTVLDLPGRVAFDASFNTGGDRVRLSHAAGDYTAVRSGSTVLLSDGDGVVALPVGPTGLDLHFADGVRTLILDTAAGVVRIGTQAITTTAVPVTTAAGTATVAGSADAAVPALLLLNEGGRATAHGVETVLGTRAGKDEVSVARGSSVTFDASFNAGGDIITLPGVTSDYMAVRSGSSVILSSATTRATIPVGIVGTTLRFDDMTEYLGYSPGADSFSYGAQRIGTTAVSVAPPIRIVTALSGAQGAATGAILFIHSGDAVLGGSINGFGRGDAVQLQAPLDRYIFSSENTNLVLTYIAGDGSLRTTTFTGIVDPAIYVHDRASAEAAAGFAFVVP